jgi:large subunit ribosomal protein L29
MMMSKAADLRAKDDAQLNQELLALLKTQFNLRFQKSTQQLTNTSQIKRTRRDIARVRTLLAEKARAK